MTLNHTMDHFLLPSIPKTPTTTGISALVLFICAFLAISRRRNTQNKKMPPQAGGAWPIIGHLPLLAGPKPNHITLSEMADKYGPVFTIQLGVNRALIVSNSEIAKECLTTNDKTSANRPKHVAMEHLGYNYAMFTFSGYGSYWRNSRSIVTLELLSNRRQNMFKHVKVSETKTWMNEIYQKWRENNEVVIDMKKWFEDLTLNVIFKMVVGRPFVEYVRNEDKDQWREIVRESFEFWGKFMVSDSLPFLRWLDIGGEERHMKKMAKKLDFVVQEWLEEHKKKRSASEKSNQDEDFMDVMLSIIDDNRSRTELTSEFDGDTVNKAMCMTLILAASDTTTVTLIWALSLLLNNPKTMKKVQHELDTTIGRERQVNESDIKNLPYLEDVIKETLRLYPASPLLLHESMENCTVGGYHVPKGTRLYVNLHKIQRDAEIWPYPDEFRPERFLTTHKNVDVRGKNFELLPFGSGRRMCPGMSFALEALKRTLATFLHGFEVGVPLGESVDMTESTGLTNLKATPLNVVISPRLPHYLYD